MMRFIVVRPGPAYYAGLSAGSVPRWSNNRADAIRYTTQDAAERVVRLYAVVGWVEEDGPTSESAY